MPSRRTKTKPTARSDRKTLGRLRGENHARDETLDSHGETIASLLASVVSLETRLANTQESLSQTRDRTKALEDFQNRNAGFAPSKLEAGNFSSGLISNAMLDSGVDGAKLTNRSVARQKIATEDLTNDEMATSTVGPRVLDLTYLDGRYVRR